MSSAAAPLGVVGLGLAHRPVPGMATHPDSFEPPVLFETLRADDLVGRVLAGDESLYDQVLLRARRLAGRGAALVGTSCGYFSVYQRRLAADLPVPVATSPLLQIPAVLPTLGPQGRLAVIWAATNELVAPALAGAGVDPDDTRLVHAGMAGPGPFRDAVLDGRSPLDLPAVTEQVLATCRRLRHEHPGVAAILLECGDLSACTTAIRRETSLPVYDYLTLFEHARASTRSTPNAKRSANSPSAR